MKDNNKPNKEKALLLILMIIFFVIAVACTSIFVARKITEKRINDNYEAMLEAQNGEAVPVIESLDGDEVGTADTAADGSDSDNNSSAANGANTDSGSGTNGTNASGTDAESATDTAALLSEYDVPDKDIDWEDLHSQNEDIYAWICIPDTKIDYPILQHPSELDHYLDYNIDGSKGYPGCIYSQFVNSKDFTDFNTVLYGHNMKNGTMFAGLHKFEDSEYFEDHSYIYVYTEDKVFVYRIFASYTFSSIHLIMGFDLSDENVRQIYIDNIRSLEGLTDNIDDSIEVDTDSRLLTLTTCIANQADKRYNVAGVLVSEIDIP